MLLIVLAGKFFFVLPEFNLFGLFFPLVLGCDDICCVTGVKCVDELPVFVVLVQVLIAAGVDKLLYDTGVELLHGRLEIGCIQFVQRIQRFLGFAVPGHAVVAVPPPLTVITFYLLDSIFCRSHQALLCSLEPAAPS
ncbi:hypothetical protein B0T44_09805 [Nocardia donostiensis]|uniref:Uncharacterized protein n=1 Tax=Nocardia donostiensis TaxID=1538463 RepID=A0A1W0BDV8_9NOCA|nr:hypothetical protein B0T46_13175 [Nocardia donostiensis]OQS20568.1 hypothetical protein B0T44_09805 [Nocardia donostiensis]